MIAAASRHRRRRKTVDMVASGAIIAAGVGVIVPLLAILVFLFAKGLPALNTDLFTQNPGPSGVAGGGIKNAIVGSAVLLALALAFGLPPAIATGVYLAEYGRGRLGFAVRFLVDVLAGVPSITIGIFVYTAVVLNMDKVNRFTGSDQKFTAARRRHCARAHHAPHRRPRDRGDAAARPADDARGLVRARRAEMAHHPHRRPPGRIERRA